MAVFVDDLKKAVIDNAKASDKIVIISGYLSPDMVDEAYFLWRLRSKEMYWEKQEKKLVIR